METQLQSIVVRHRFPHRYAGRRRVDGFRRVRLVRIERRFVREEAVEIPRGVDRKSRRVLAVVRANQSVKSLETIRRGVDRWLRQIDEIAGRVIGPENGVKSQNAEETQTGQHENDGRTDAQSYLPHSFIF